MARPKTYKVELVIQGIDKYFYIENYGNPKSLVRREIAKYLNVNGYCTDINDRKIGSDKNLREHIEMLKQKSKQNEVHISLNYVPLNVNDFLKVNNTKIKLKEALTLLDNYYSNVYQFALIQQKESKATKKDNYKLQKENDDLKFSVQENTSELKRIKGIKNVYYKEMMRYKKHIKTDLLPEIANEILRDEHILFQGEKMITEEGYDEMVVDNFKSIDGVLKDIRKKDKKFDIDVLNDVLGNIEEDY